MKKILFLCIIICISTFAFSMEVQQATGDELALFQAIEKGDIEKIKELINKGVNVNIERIYKGEPQEPAMFALKNGKNEIARLLFTELTSPEEKKFFEAVQNGDINTIKILIQTEKNYNG